MALEFNTSLQLLWAIIRPAKQLREISTARIQQGQKVMETLFGSLRDYSHYTLSDMSYKNCE